MFKLSEVADNHVQATVEHTVKKFTYCECVQAPNDDDDSETFDFHSVLYSCTVLCPVPKHTMDSGGLRYTPVDSGVFLWPPGESSGLRWTPMGYG